MPMQRVGLHSPGQEPPQGAGKSAVLCSQGSSCSHQTSDITSQGVSFLNHNSTAENQPKTPRALQGARAGASPQHGPSPCGQRGTTAGNSRGCSARPAPSAAAEASLSENSIYQHQVLPTRSLTCRGPQLMVSRTCQCRISETRVPPRARGRPLRHTNLINSC